MSTDKRDGGREPDDDLRDLARELLEAEEAYRHAPTLDNTSRLARARRRLEAVLAVGVQQ
jgi:hypothetical protein